MVGYFVNKRFLVCNKLKLLLYFINSAQKVKIMTTQREKGSSTIHFKSGEVIDAKTSEPVKRTPEEIAADQLVYNMLFSDNPPVRG